MIKDYPKLSDSVELLRYIVKERKIDVQEFINLKNIFMSGRKVGKVPTGASDVDPEDRIGDINYDSSYLYILIDNAGTAEWRRAALSTF